MVSIKTHHHEVTLSGATDLFQVSLSASQQEEGIDLIQIKVVAQSPATPSPMTLSWVYPIVDIHSLWHSGADHKKMLVSDWDGPMSAKATSQAPVVCLHSLSGRNGLTFAFSDTLNALEMRAGVNEETATLRCSITLFVEPWLELDTYEATLRIDTRPVPYYESLARVQHWWASQPGYRPAPVPETARLPMYSTWYSFHQQLAASKVEEQCTIARQAGCEAVIVDDGWQTTDTARGYAYTGDWQVTPTKIPDMKAHVAHIHQLGMRYILWYSVPFVGRQSKAWSRFADQMLYTIERLNTGVLDPRFPAVREYIINTYERALRDWELDGFKLDFVDSFVLPREKQHERRGEQDYLSVPEAVDRLLTDVIERLRAIKSDIMIEFRQSYIGPLMRKYGNMFRAMDCPNDALTNRIRTLDIRLLSGNTATHADMLMWHPDEPVESAALQIINVLFAVPQISVLLDTLPSDHLAMVRFWLSFWRAHRDVLLDGRLMPQHPESLYPVVVATTETKRVIVMYQASPLDPGSELPATCILINGTREDGMVLALNEDVGPGQLEIRNCQGQIIREEQVLLKAGLHRVQVPASGLAIYRGL